MTLDMMTVSAADNSEISSEWNMTDAQQQEMHLTLASFNECLMIQTRDGSY